MVKSNVILVTSGQPSANPRLLKEATSLIEYGFSVKVIWCPISEWADTFDQDLFRKSSSITWIRAGYHFRQQRIKNLYARFRKKIWHLIFLIFGNIFDAAIKSHVLFSQELIETTRKYHADLYIGHNLGALPAIVSASKKYNAKCIFDFEDFHRGEFSQQTHGYLKTIQIENKYIPFVNSTTASSELISEAYHKIFEKTKITTIRNVFYSNYSINHVSSIDDYPIKLFWFSQHIGKNRGLESVLVAMSKLKSGQVTLTLLGNCIGDQFNYFEDLIEVLSLDKRYIKFLKPIAESEIVRVAANHHIGLCTEPGRDLNNEYALSNKIMIYLLAGNALICSDTLSQKAFLDKNQDIGQIYQKDNPDSLLRVLRIYLNNPCILKLQRINSLKLAKERMNWEIEQTHFIDNVITTLES